MSFGSQAISGGQPRRHSISTGNIPPSVGTTNPLASTSAGTLGVSTGSSNPTTTNTKGTAIGPGNITLVECLIADPSWPSTLILDLVEENWVEWSRRIILLSERSAVSKYLKGTLACPNPTMHADAHQIWETNDTSLRAFMLERMTTPEFSYTSSFDTSHAVFEALRTRHKKLGSHAQINLLLKEFGIFYEPSILLTTTSNQLRQLHERMQKMGTINEDKLFLFVIINALGHHYPQLQSEIHGMTDDPNFNWVGALRRVNTEAALVQRNAEVRTTPTTVALVGTSSSDPKAPTLVCSNCKRLHHTIDFCIKQGGKMAGQTLEEAKAAQRAATGKPPRSARGGRTSCQRKYRHYYPKYWDQHCGHY